MHKLFTGLLLALSFAAVAGENKSCSLHDCAAGSMVVSYATRSEPYFACPSQELSDYTNYVLGIIEMNAMFGEMPNISPDTGEPEQTGKSRAILDYLRIKARVSTFDQAVAACKKGRGGLRLMVANNPKGGTSMWVFERKTKKSFWAPKSSIDLP